MLSIQIIINISLWLVNKLCKTKLNLLYLLKGNNCRGRLIDFVYEIKKHIKHKTYLVFNLIVWSNRLVFKNTCKYTKK